MPQQVTISRRDFLKAGAAAGTGLLLAMHLPLRARAAAQAEQAAKSGATFAPNAWIRIDTDGAIIIEVARSEMGQGVLTALPMLVAEELAVRLDQISARFAPADKAYTNQLIGSQLTGGSTSVRDAYSKLREAGAVAREMLIAAAAESWGVDPESCRAENALVSHPPSGRQATYADLAAKAAEQPVPQNVFLKEPGEWTLIGTPAPRLDTPDKAAGTARFGIDVRLPKQVMASVERCPVFGGKLKKFDASDAKKVSGVIDVVPIESGVAVVAKDTWAAFKGRKALKVDWDEGPNADVSSESIHKAFEKRMTKPGAPARSEGDADRALRNATIRIEAVYSVPFQAHACMEPMNCTADVRADGCDVYVPTQAQTRTQQTAMKLTGLPQEKVRVHTTFLGGGFGRRSEVDFVEDAVALSAKLKRPVQVVWTREDDTRHDFYRPATLNRMSGGLGSDGKILAWRHHIVGPSIMSRVSPGAVKDGIDRTSVEGAANIPYTIENIQVDYSLENTAVPVGFWRSVGSSQNAYVTECFLDELAVTAGRDPVEVRRELLKDAPRHLRVLELAAEKADWGKALPKGRSRGVAVAEAFGGYVAQVAEVSIDANKQVRVHRVVCAVDVGPVVNPDTVEAQMQSGIVYGLTAALKSSITIDKGRVVQGNFDNFPLLRIDEMPQIEVHIVKALDEPIGGVGEPGTPPIAPAVANAVFAATGNPVRSLPIKL
jgi:isoquinoline 1-oxidoreductase subunit beta